MASKGQRKGEEEALEGQTSAPGEIDAKDSVTVAQEVSLSGAGSHGKAKLGLVRICGKDVEQVVEDLSDTSLGGELHGAVTAMPQPKLYAAAEAARVVSWELQIIDVKIAELRRRKK